MSTQSQEISAELSKKTGFQKGNKHGKNGRPPAGQGLKDRLAWWMQSKTVKQIEDLIADEKKWGNLVAADAHCARVVAEGCKATGLSAIQFIFDRLLGKAPQAITGEDGKPLLPATDLNEIARRTAFLLSLASQQTITIDQPAISAPSPPARALDE